ncbi:GNAT family N-acetyltransferase [Longispora sp. NPDC051575]|uniref:GNAT family N-acetyltransferase n=1 Tax=Longispora sp. NPDC051575 TaxID=3154943 RepID=UPI00342438F8
MSPETVLAGAFVREPGMAWLCGDRKLPWFAATARLPGTVARSAPSAAALLTPPGHRPGQAAQLAWTARVATRCGPGAVRRTLTYLRAAERHKPAGAWTLEFIGVLPRARGTGAGRLLLDRILAEFGDVWLTTADPANVPLYRHFGFAVTGEWRVGPLGVTGMRHP